MWVGSFLRHYSTRRTGEVDVQPVLVAGGGSSAPQPRRSALTTVYLVGEKHGASSGQGAAGDVLWLTPLEDGGKGPRPQSCAIMGSPRAWSRASPGSLASSRYLTGDLLKPCSLTTPITGFSVLRGGRGGGEGELLARHHWHKWLVHLWNTTGGGGQRRGEGRRAGELARPPAPRINTWLI